MPPLIIDTMQAFRESILRQEVAQMQRLAAAWARVEATLQDRLELLAAELQERRRNGESLPRWRVERLERFQELLREVRVQQLQFGQAAAREIEQAQRTLAALGLDHADTMIRLAAGSVDIRFNRLNVGALENMVGLAGDGSPLNTLLRQAFGEGAEQMTRQLMLSTALGRNPRDTARLMAQGNRQAFHRTLTIARTEQLRVYREASRQQYEASGVVEGFMRLSAKDSAVCPACLMADGEFYAVQQPLRSHPNCRCTMVPRVADMPPVTWQRGRDWFVRQDAATQRTILGPGRYDAWRAGRFDLDQLVQVRHSDTWGDSVQVAPLRELV